MEICTEVENWEDFINILGLPIYNVILLPHLDEYINLPTIDVFLANQEWGRNPVTAALANTYYTIQNYHERRGGRLICCLQALYLWLVIHTCPCRCVTTCLVEDLKWCWVKRKTGEEWAHFLRDLTDKVIRWYLKWNEREELPFHTPSLPVGEIQEPYLAKGKEVVEVGNEKEDLKSELGMAYKGQKRACEEVDKERKIPEHMTKHARIEEEI
ncbi:hypothetical protein CR513_03755, partial [Mucuna pruriens]